MPQSRSMPLRAAHAPRLKRRHFLRWLGGAAAATALAAWGGHRYATEFEPGKLSIERLGVPFAGLHPALEGLRIALLSDFHLYPYTQLPLIEQTVSWTNFMQPDIVVLAGDYVLSEVEAIQELAPALGKLNARYGVFAIMGNHDAAQWIGSDVVAAGLRAAGIHTLIDEAVTLGVGAGLIYLMGLDDAYWATPNPGALVYGCPAGALPILALHEPDPADDVAALGRVALQLSGHSHGGQVRLPGIGAPVLPPMGQKYDQGLYRVGDMWLYTTRGIGVTGPPVRFNCPPEITEITLMSGA